MVPTLSTITTEIASQLKKELDEPFKRMLAEKVDNWRSRLIRNSLEKKPWDAKFYLQTIYIPMERRAEAPDCINVPGTCPVSMSISNIPKPLRYNTQLFNYLGSADGSRAFMYAPDGTGEYLTAGKYSRHSVLYKWNGEKVWIPDHPNLPMIRITHIFDNPSEILEFNCNGTAGCDFWEQPYPCTRDILQQIVQYIVQEYNPPVGTSDKSIEVTPQKQLHEPDGR